MKEENLEVKIEVKEEDQEMEISVKEENQEINIRLKEENQEIKTEVKEKDDDKYPEQAHLTQNTTNQVQPVVSSRPSGLQAVAAGMTCRFPLPTSAKQHPAKSIQARIGQVQEQQILSNRKFRRLQCSLRIQKAKIDYQQSMLEAQKVVIDSQTSELERLKTMLEEMSRRMSNLEQSHASRQCCAKNGLSEGAATKDSPVSSPVSTVDPMVTSAPAKESKPKVKPPATSTPVFTMEDIPLRTLSLDREEAFYRNSFYRGEHQPDAYAACVFMSLVPFQIYNSWVKKCNWAGTNGKTALPSNIKERVHSLVSQRFPNLTVAQWHQIRSRINERLRCPRKVDPETPRPGYSWK